MVVLVKGCDKMSVLCAEGETWQDKHGKEAFSEGWAVKGRGSLEKEQVPEKNG